MIINLRGNSGSGKTTLARAFMEKCRRINDLPSDPDQCLKFGKQYWIVLGRYANACGGCDTIKTQQEIIDRVERYTKDGFNVLLEGLILSTIYGSVGAYSEKFGDRWVFAYLQPPIEECIRRIKARRKAAGNTKPLNEANTRARFATIQRNKEIVLEHGRRVVELDWSDPLPELLKIVRREG
jgi:thymidylate kinase